jgi:aflatoxin B1 aldehyde reductase
MELPFMLTRKCKRKQVVIVRANNTDSPTASGTLTENHKTESVRWGDKFPYKAPYHQEPILAASAKIRREARMNGTSGHAAVVRWCLHHSILSPKHGDAVILGASSVEQLQENLKFAGEGPLPTQLVETIEEVWPLREPVAPWAWF